jgi:uncharacterized protein YndB with AHSA1/START domain
MSTNITATASIEIHADIEQVWNALVDPEMISKYLFGTKTTTTWEPGTPITFSGEWDGKSYEDKGQIQVYEEYRRLQYTYWSSMSGIEDRPENYYLVTFELAVRNGATLLTVRQENIKDEATRAHSESNWSQVLQSIKQLLEHTGEKVIAE